MRDRKTGTRVPSPAYPSTKLPYAVDRWGVVHRISKAEKAITSRLLALPKLNEVRHAS